MADRFANGLKLTAATASQCGRTFSRWLVEWLTQVCGWEVFDVVSGTGWTNILSSGSDGATSSTSNQFVSATATFAAADLGGYLTITGFTGRFVSRNGIYRIRKIINATTVELEVERSVHEDGFPDGLTGLIWRLWRPVATYVPTGTDVIVLKGRGTTGSGYDFHLHVASRSTNSYFPELRMSPFASWNSGSHSWNDSRYTSAIGIDNASNSLINVDNCRVWGAADADRSVIMFRTEDDYFAWHFLYLGEIDTFFPSSDPCPCVAWAGSNPGNATPAGDAVTLLGYGAASNINGRGNWLSYDELTTIGAYLTFSHSPYSSEAHWLAEGRRRFSTPTRRNYLLDLVCESRTSGHMEFRGKLRRVWISGRDHQRETPFGANSEYLHIIGGITIPWFNTKVWYQV